MSEYSFDAVIFDLDGVITRTALVHSAAWKKMFDDYLRERQVKYGEPFREFSHELDYLRFVDGKPRYKGVESFLQSRGIKIPWGDTEDTPDKETICGIGNRKNIAFNDILARDGVEVYESSVILIRQLKEAGIHVGVASSSKNCMSVLKAAGLLELMEVRIDGEASEVLHLKGKPEPDIFTTACDQLGIPYDRAVVVEDAESGVRAGRAGNFGLVIGIAREENERALHLNGADIVVKDLEEIGITGIENWFRNSLPLDNWSISYLDYEPGKEGTRESLLAVGNGYFATRGAMEESRANGINYPGTYMSGVYNRLTSEVAGKEIENEDLVNCINWLPISFRIGDGPWLDINNIQISHIRRILHLDNGILERILVVRDHNGRETRISSRRLASMDDPHIAAIEYSVTPLNYSEKIIIRSGLHGDHMNAGVPRYKELNQQHLKPVLQSGKGPENYLLVQTTTSGINLAAVSKLNVFLNDKSIQPEFSLITAAGKTETIFSQEVLEGESLIVHKIVSLYTSHDHVPDILAAAKTSAGQYKSFVEVLKLSGKKWEEIWDRINVRIEGDRLAQKLLRLHLYHLIVTTSPHNAFIDAGIPARGLHGEAYRGHIFWDELYILPLYYLHYRSAAESALMYRYHRLDAARRYATEYGYRGAMFPWQSASDGREETQVIHLNPLTGEWGPDHSSLQRHVSLAIAYNVLDYYHITGNMGFMESYGAELLFEICRFWTSASILNKQTGRYEISKVMGPDEFHEKYPDAKEGGLKDNAYTNLMVAWTLQKAMELLQILQPQVKERIFNKIRLDEEELRQWQQIRKKLNLVVSDEGIISQYDGYFDLKELDWDYYRQKFGNIYRLDRILKAEGKSPDEYKVAKQADTLMTFYNLDKEEVDRILDNLGYKLPGDYLERNLRYYLDRTSHGSTLSRVVHARLANLIGDQALSWKMYLDALTSDYQDIQGGTTSEGIHAGVMAGTVWIAISTYAGLNLRSDIVRFNPRLPVHWRRFSFRFSFRDEDYECDIRKDSIRLRIDSMSHEHIEVEIKGERISVKANEWTEIPLT